MTKSGNRRQRFANAHYSPSRRNLTPVGLTRSDVCVSSHASCFGSATLTRESAEESSAISRNCGRFVSGIRDVSSAIAFAIVVAFARPVDALERQRLDFRALVAASDVVVVGRVVAVDVMSSGPSGRYGIHSRSRIRVEQALRGAAGPELVVWTQGGRLARRSRVSPGQAEFQVGDRAVVFASATSDGSLWPTGMALGKWPITPAGAVDVVVVPAELAGPLAQRSEVSLERLSRAIAEVVDR